MSAPTIPDTVEGFQEVLNDEAKVTELTKDMKVFGQFINGYVQAVSKKDSTIEEQIRLEVDKTWSTFCVENGIDPKTVADGKVRRPNLSPFARAKSEPPTSQIRKQELYNEHAIGATVDGAALFADAGEFLRTIHHRSQSAELIDKRSKLREITDAYSSQVPSDGGFLVPETIRSEILELALETAVVRPRATVIAMDTLRVSMPMVDSTTNVGSVMGGVIAYWTEEGAALVESTAKFSRVVLEAKKLTAYAAPPNELLKDSEAFRSWFQRSFPRAISWFEDLAFLRGTGVGEPLGVFRAPATVTQAKEGSQAANTIVWNNITKMYSRMLPTSLGSAVWIANLNTFPQLASMELSSGSPAVWLNNGIAEGPPMTILGRPVIFTEKADTLGTEGDISFVDLNYYLIGDRQAMEAEASEHYRFGNDQTAFRIIERVDGRPWINSAVTPHKGAATLSPFVRIETR